MRILRTSIDEVIGSRNFVAELAIAADEILNELVQAGLKNGVDVGLE
jgi:hypothetical protein